MFDPRVAGRYLRASSGTGGVKAIVLLALVAFLASCGESDSTPPPESTAATPAFSVAAGTYAAAQTVTISDTTIGAKIYYTTDGSTPSAASAVYSSAITVSTSKTLKAMATASGYKDSGVATAAYTIQLPPAATPTFSLAGGTYTGAQTVTISDSTTDAKIYYTVDGSAPTSGSTLYSGAITVSVSMTLKAMATASGYADSAVASAVYTIEPPKAATPTFSIPGGTYTKVQTVTISDATTGGKIYYTADGSAPTTSSALYSGPIGVSKSETIQAMAAASGYTDSAVASAAYVINLSNFGFVAPHEWTEMSGNDTGTARYGTQGIAAPDNTPGGRSMGMSWTDASGNLWLFGGMTPPHLQELFNDLWKYDPNTQRWMWVNGPENVSPANTCTTVHYGTLGVADPANLPGCRGGGSTWTDAKGRLWMFGGYGSDSTGTGFKLLNDVWMFDPSNVNPRTGTVGVWTWMSGSSSVSTINQGVYNTKGVADPTNTPGGRSRGVSWTDASGKLWLFGGSGFGDNSSGAGMQLNDLWRFDPDAANPVSGVNGVWTWMGGGSTISQANGVWDSTEGAYPSGRDGSAVWVDAGGKFWLFGGQGYSASGPPATLMNDMWVYEPTAANATTGTDGVWTWVGGSSAGNVVSGTPVVGTPSTSYWPGSRCLMQGWADRAGMFWIYGGYGEFSATPPGNLNELWVYNPQTAEWALMSGSTAVHNATAPPVAVREAQGTPDPNANPGYLQGGSGWLDANGNLWLFGGATTGNDSNGNPYSEGTGLNNLWVYDPYAIASPLRRR